MRLHTKIGQANIGTIKSQPVWQLFFSLVLTPEERQLVDTYRLGDHPLCRYNDNEDKEHYLLLHQAINGKGGHVFITLSRLNAMKASMIEGCAILRDYLQQIREIRGGGGAQVFDFEIQQPAAQSSPSTAPPVIPANLDSASAPPPVIPAGF